MIRHLRISSCSILTSARLIEKELKLGCYKTIVIDVYNNSQKEKAL